MVGNLCVGILESNGNSRVGLIKLISRHRAWKWRQNDDADFFNRALTFLTDSLLFQHTAVNQQSLNQALVKQR
jgi:hypothetical protein